MAVALAVASVSWPAAAEEIRALGRAEFLERFEQSDPRFGEITARIDVSHAEVTAAKTLPNPELAYDREEVFPSGGSLPENYLRVELPIEISGRRGRRIRAAEAGVEATRAAAERERLMLGLEALETYYDAALARLQVEALREIRGSLESLGRALAARASAGDVSGYDRGRLEIELTAHDDLLAEAEARLAAVRRTLATLAGESGTLVDASDPLAIPAPPALTDREAASGLEERADYRGLRQRLRQAELELSAAQRGWVPSLSLSAGWKSSDTGSETADGYLAGAGVSIPLFDRGQAERGTARAMLRQTEARLRFLSLQVPLAIANARDELGRQVQRARQFETLQLPRLERLLRRAEISYREGERSVFELLDAYRTARETRLRALDLRHAANQSEVDLWRALGRRP